MFNILVLFILLCGITIGNTYSPECGGFPWIHREGKCYTTNSFGSGIDFFQSKERCEKLGATVVTISTDAENRFIHQNVTAGNGCFWIGLQEVAYDLQRYAWMDHSQFSVAYWDTTQSRKRSACNAFAMRNGLWLEMDCSDTCAMMCQKYLTKNHPKSLSNKAIDRIGETQMTIVELQSKADERIEENERKITELDSLTSKLLIACVVLLILVVVLIITVVIVCVLLGRFFRNK